MLDWFRGGAAPYHTLLHCMRHDLFWIALVVIADLVVFFGYLAIARTWGKHAKTAPDSDAARAMSNLRFVFVFCSVTYLWSLVDLVWPAWRLFALAKIALVFYTLRFAVRAQHLDVVYRDVRRAAQMAHRIEMLEREVTIWKTRARDTDDETGDLRPTTE